MINFRFHIISLIAVFLAVGLGILVGSTVVDQKIVNRLDREIQSVRNENAERKEESKQLAQQNSSQQEFIELTAPFVVDGRLDGQSVAVVAERGVDGSTVKKAETLLRSAGADVPAVLWLDDAWLLDTDSRLQDLESALDISGDAQSIRAQALSLLARRLGKAPTSTVSTSTTRPATSTTRPGTSTTRRVVTVPRLDALTELEDAGFVTVTDGDPSELDTFPSHAAHVLLITGDDSHFRGTEMTAVAARAFNAAKLPTVVAAIYDAGSDPATAPERGASLSSVLDDRVLSKAVSTVDDLELEQGRLATTLALEVIANGAIGHYGYGPDASAPVPPHPS
jgi:hypothetical protein